ncbi:MAG: hypothetical protein ACR2NM_10370 [Bythopirellula sp.]
MSKRFKLFGGRCAPQVKNTFLAYQSERRRRRAKQARPRRFESLEHRLALSATPVDTAVFANHLVLSNGQLETFSGDLDDTVVTAHTDSLALDTTGKNNNRSKGTSRGIGLG